MLMSVKLAVSNLYKSVKSVKSSFTDINECEDNPSVCDDMANCTNSPGSFECTCIHGFTGSGLPDNCMGKMTK